jgi:hypothetical protein
MANTASTLLDHLNLSFDEWFVLVSIRQVEAWSAGKLVHEFLHWLKFSIPSQSPLHVIDI